MIPRATELSEAQAAVRRFSIKTAGVEEPVATLSGGNQQKVVLARWMEAHVKLLILEEPTIGVDVGAKADIYHLLQSSLRKGLAVLLISSDFEEVERICHRALVFSRGQVAAEIPGRALTVAALTSAASGGSWTARHGSGLMSRDAARSVRRRRHSGDLRLGPACPVRPSGHRVFIAEAGHVSHLFQHPLHSQQQVGAAPGGAFGVHSDGRQSVRPLGRIQCRHLAGAGDRAARPGFAVVGGGVRRCCSWARRSGS